MRRVLRRVPYVRAVYRWYRSRPTYPLLAILPRRSVGAEVGVFRGAFSRRAFAKLRPRRLYLIDAWEYREDLPSAWFGSASEMSPAAMEKMYRRVRRQFAVAIWRGVVSVHRCRSTEFQLPANSLDWVYIDADHSYEAVKADLAHYARMLKPGGLLTGDDYGSEGWWGDGVRRAVDEFVARERYEVVYLETQYALRKPR